MNSSSSSVYCTSLIIRLCIWRSSVLTTDLHHVQRWIFVTESYFHQTLIRQFDVFLSWRKFPLRRISFIDIFWSSCFLEIFCTFGRLFMETSNCKSFSEKFLGGWSVILSWNSYFLLSWLFSFSSFLYGKKDRFLHGSVYMTNSLSFDILFSVKTKDNFYIQMDFSLSFWRCVVLLNCIS